MASISELFASRHVVSATLVITGVIHLLPLSGVLGADQLAKLYGMPFGEPNLQILMRHRAVLFGLLSAFLIASAFMPALQTAAFIAGFASVVSFLRLAWNVGGYNPQISRVVIADVVALVCLVIGGVALVVRMRGN